MKDTQKRFIGAVLAAGSVAGIVAPSVTAMATVVEDENKATAEDLKAVIAEYTTKLEENTIFANYHRVQYAAERLAQYDKAASQEALANIAKYADKVFTAEVKTIVDKMDGFATSKSMASYDELVTKDIKAMENKENAEYLMGRLDVWGKAVVFEVDPNYVKATDAIMEVANLVNAGKYDAAEKQVVVAKDAIKAIKTYEVNGAYLEGKLKVEEDILAEKANLKVVSAEAINAKEIKVVFNKEVDEDSAINEGNYTLYVGKDENNAKVDLKEGKLQDDNKTVILQLKDTKKIENGQSYKIEAKNVIDVNGKKVDSYKGDFTIFNDKTAPALVATEYTGSTVKFTFDEPLKEMPTVKIDSTTIDYNKDVKDEDGNFVAFSTDAGEYELTVSLEKAPQKVKDLGKHTVKISGVTDFADNIADMITTEYTATEDNEKPVVKSIEDDSEDTFIVKLNTEMKNFDEANLEVKKGNHQFANVKLVDTNSKNDEFTFKVSNDGDNKLYEDGEKSVELSVKVKDYTGTNGKVGDDYKSKVTLTKDETAPVVTEALNRVDGNDTLVVYFDKDLKEDQTINKNKISIVRDGIREDVGTAVAKGKRLEIKLDGNKALETGKYSITLEKGAVVDKADNKNEAVTTTINYTNDNANRAKVKPVITSDTNKDNSKNVINVDFGKYTDENGNVKPDNEYVKMDNSALDLSNYMIDGTKLSDSMYAGTTIAFTDSTSKNTVEITLVKGTVDEKGEKAVKLSKDITTDKGEYISNKEDDKEVSQKIELLDDTNPEVDKVEFITNNSNATTTKVLRVKFTEEVTTSNALDIKNNFVVRDASGNKVNIDTAVIGEEEDTIIITLNREVSTKKTVTVEVTDDKDDNTNKEINVIDKSSLKNELETCKVTVVGVEVNSTLNPNK